MTPSAWRDDCWPICPGCGKDGLAIVSSTVVTIGNITSVSLFCYYCRRETVHAGETSLSPGMRVRVEAFEVVP